MISPLAKSGSPLTFHAVANENRKHIIYMLSNCFFRLGQTGWPILMLYHLSYLRLRLNLSEKVRISEDNTKQISIYLLLMSNGSAFERKLRDMRSALPLAKARTISETCRSAMPLFDQEKKFSANFLFHRFNHRVCYLLYLAK